MIAASPPEPAARLRILTVFGTRPEAIKLAPVLAALAARPDRFDSRVCVTGQHRALLDPTLALFGIRPDVDLALLAEGQSLAALAAAILARLDPLIADLRPDWVLVQGDTITAMAASLAAWLRQVRLGHVEAGLRSPRRDRPFPEEANRRIAGQLATRHLAPSESAAAHLRREGVPDAAILVTGNTIVEALAAARAAPGPGPELPADVAGRRLVVVTMHRRESFGAPVERVCDALVRLADRHRADTRFVVPLHRNPAVRLPLERRLTGHPAICLLPPLDYHRMVRLLEGCHLVLTDSGGLQEEGPLLGKPVLVLRDETERDVCLAAGATRLVGTDSERIVAETARLLDDDAAYAAMAGARVDLGDGRASARIVAALAG